MLIKKFDEMTRRVLEMQMWRENHLESGLEVKLWIELFGVVGRRCSFLMEQEVQEAFNGPELDINP